MQLAAQLHVDTVNGRIAVSEHNAELQNDWHLTVYADKCVRSYKIRI